VRPIEKHPKPSVLNVILYEKILKICSDMHYFKISSKYRESSSVCVRNFVPVVHVIIQKATSKTDKIRLVKVRLTASPQ
jgi:hypothetical protein